MTTPPTNQHPTGVAPPRYGGSGSVDGALRREAEARAQTHAADTSQMLDTLSPEQVRVVLHELRVHQIELEMQNEELRRAHAELDATQARYFDLYDLAPVGYCTISESGLILQANLTAASLLGLARQALIRQPIFRFVLKADRATYHLHHKQLFDTRETQSCELRMVKNDGASVWINMVASIALDSDGLSVHRVMLIDVTERKRMEEALLEKNDELAQAKRVADKANLAKSEFLSSMSHEFRSPLNAILGFAQLLESGSPPPTPSQMARIAQILKAGWYLLELVNEILDLAVIESGKVSMVLEPLALSEVMLDCQGMVDPQLQNSDIHISYPAADEPHFVSADRTHLKQVLLNLISNAVKYNRAGGTVAVTCSLRHANRLRISVRDTGLGLYEDQLAQLFQPFNRLGQEAGAVKGTGIGLVVSKRLVALMGGEIGVQSTVGVGSVFWVELDRFESPQAPQAPQSSATQASDVHMRTLLYVEDNRANMALIAELIALRPDMRLLCAVDGLRGIALARSQQPDVILMDINLPGISGLDALKILRSDPLTRHIPVLALSADAMERDIRNGLAAGFMAYVTKPIKLSAFMLALDQALVLASLQADRTKQGDAAP